MMKMLGKTGCFTQEENQILYQIFCSSVQEKKKLGIALENILYQEEVEKVIQDTYLNYIKRRYRSAIAFIKEIEQEEFLWNKDIIEDKVWGNVRWNLARKYPYFASAFTVLKSAPGKDFVPGCDGTYLYYPKNWDVVREEKELRELCKLYLHMVLHCLFGHVLHAENREWDRWNLACDLYVEFLLQKDFPGLFSLNFPEKIKQNVLGEIVEEKEKQKNEILCILKKKVQPFQTETLYDYLKKEQEIENWTELFKRDSHEFWKRNFYKSCIEQEGEENFLYKEKQSQARLEKAEKWSRIRRKIQVETGGNIGKRGSAKGSQKEEVILKKNRKHDYRKFLERFTFPGEEMMLDLESFDYIPYTYSRNYYEKLVFLEPLEYAEVHKVRELIIAIDTSGSCRGEVVRNFLEETYTILSRKENFFRKMRIHLIQCDSMIQEYVCIESQEQWQEYVKHLKVQGLGGTDFRPVFELVEQMRKKGEVERPGGLIYFTDGDGIYPRKAPDYETAFVFLNDALKKGKVPPWAVELNLQIALEEERE